MRHYRQEKISSLIQKKLGWILIKSVEVEGAIITITSVDVSRKLDYAFVKVSVLPGEKAEQVIRILKKRKREFQSMLLRETRLRFIPNIEFEFDRGAENAARVEKALLDDIQK